MPEATPTPTRIGPQHGSRAPDAPACLGHGSFPIPASTDRGEVALQVETEISRGLVRLCKERTGRGPSNVRTQLSDHLVAVLLGDLMTQVEQSLLERQRHDLVSETRRQLCEVLRGSAVDIVESSTGREVAAFTAGCSLEPDFTVFSFVLARTDAATAA